MSVRVVIEFRDGTKREWPDPKSSVMNSRGYRVKYGDGVVTLMDPYDHSITWPLDIIASITEEPQKRW